MPRRFFLFVLLFVGTILCSGADVTPQAWVHIDGYTYHMVARDCNNLLLGSGLTWYTRDDEKLRTAWEADAFADSARKLAAYAGYSVGLPLRAITIGMTGAIMYHRNFAAENRLRTLPVAFPFLEFECRFKVRIYYVPPVRRASDEQVAVQLLVPIGR